MTNRVTLQAAQAHRRASGDRSSRKSSSPALDYEQSNALIRRSRSIGSLPGARKDTSSGRLHVRSR